MIWIFVIRNLAKSPFLNLIKVAGLSLALSCILLILLFLHNELTFDRFHDNSERIYRLSTTQSNSFYDKHFARIPNPGFVPALADYFPEIESYVRLVPIRGGVIKYKEKYLELRQAFECDSTFFDVFDTELISGNPAGILDDPGSLIISESYSQKIFGDNNPVGQILTLPSGQFYGKDLDFTIKGVMKDFPQNSHFHPEFIASPVDKSVFNSWAWTYLLLHENSVPLNISSGFAEFTKVQLGYVSDDVVLNAHLQGIESIHLHSKKLREIEPNSNMAVVFTLSIAVLILLLIALINYANLNIGMAAYYHKYFIISRISGASTLMKFKHFLSEGTLIVIASISFGIFFSLLASSFIQKEFNLNLLGGKASLIMAIISLFSIIIIFAGLIPLLKRFGSKGISKSLIVIQYTISIALIIAVIVIQQQTNFALRSSMGIEDDNIICIGQVHTNIQSEFEIFKEELLKSPAIEHVSAMLEPPGGEANDIFQFEMEGYISVDENNPDNYIGIFPCDYSFASIFSLNFLSGHNFSETNLDNEGSSEYIINESAMRRLHYTDHTQIIGKEFDLIFGEGDLAIPKGHIIGVVEDFHLSSVKKEIEPLVLFKRQDMWLINFVISFEDGMQTQALTDIENVWTQMFPEYPFQYKYLSSMYEDLYKSELLQARLLFVFTLISLFICSMGLLGMSLLKTQSRTKEIGIRKVNGAKVSQILGMLTWDFIKWILISVLVAIPIAYYAMNKWLENFAYKTSISLWIFLLAGIVAIIIALVTVSVQSWKAANQNPVEALRCE